MTKDREKKSDLNTKPLAVQSLAENLLRPIHFAVKDDFARLDTVKGLGNTAERIIERMEGAPDIGDWAPDVKRLKGLFSVWEDLAEDEKRDNLTKSLDILERIIHIKNDKGEKVERPKESKEQKKTPVTESNIPVNFLLSKEKLNTPVTFVKGVGPKRSEVLKKRGIVCVEDLLYLFPRYYIDLTKLKKIRDLSLKEHAALIVDVVAGGEKITSRRGKKIYEVIVMDGNDFMSLVWFNAPYMKGRLKPGTRFLIRGVTGEFGGRKNMAHPDFEPWEGDRDDYQGDIIPRYPLPERMRLATIVKIVKEAKDKYVRYLPDGIPEDIRTRNGLMPLRDAISLIHMPDSSMGDPDVNDGSWLPVRSVAADELFIMELGLLLRKRNIIKAPGRSYTAKGRLTEKFISNLPFSLTSAQGRVLGEITGDMRSPHPAYRLIQGDVGCGKTVVAIAAALLGVEDGVQAAIMAPTEVLSEQHYRGLSPRLEEVGVRSALLTSSVKGKARDEILSGIRDGGINIIFGTHALIQEGVEFFDLGFIVVDEQHRFGVLQRGALKEKGQMPEVIVMTATPIPRTLALTVYGDLDISTIDELPPGRIAIKTRVFGDAERKKAYDIIKDELKLGHQAYIVYPLVSESESLDLLDATGMAEKLKDIFSEFQVGLITGRMKGDEKDKIMGGFARGEIDILVATTVVEVGLDVPNATVMMVEHAERFGLSQLHQLRGRVGRGGERSHCILVSDYRKTEDARRRLEIMEKTTDGFVIAEEDLKIRGPGEFLGTKQSGLPEFRAADLMRDFKTLVMARKEALALIESDPTLSDPAHRMTKEVLLSRFEGRLSLIDIG